MLYYLLSFVKYRFVSYNKVRVFVALINLLDTIREHLMSSKQKRALNITESVKL